MLTYNDGLGLGESNGEEAAALARIKHLPEVVALEMGLSLRRTPRGKDTIRRMILDDIEAACRRRDVRTAARLGLALHRFLEDHCARGDAPPAGPRAEGDHLPRALGLGPMAARWMRAGVDTYMAGALRHLGLDRASARERFPTEMRVAETCCAACDETRRCRRFLAGVPGTEALPAFCPNAPLFHELAQGGAASCSEPGPAGRAAK